MQQTMISFLLAGIGLTGSGSLLQAQTADTLAATQDSIHSSMTLQEVRVTAPSRTRMKGDAMLTRIVGSVVENAGTAEDALARVPGMTTRNGRLEVVGKGTPVYYINGRKVSDLTELQRLSSHDIKDVEVINSPGARYDAQVSAVVRIRTLRRNGEGWGVSLDSRDAKGLSCGNNQWASTLNLSYRHRSLDVFGGFTYNNDHLGEYATAVTQHSYAAKGMADYGQESSTDMGWQHNNAFVQIGMGWQVAENHSVGFKVDRYANMKGATDFNMQSRISKNGLPTDRLVTDTHTDTDHSSSWLANAYYMGKLGRWGIDWNVDFFRGSEAVTASTAEQSETGNRHILSHNSVRNRFFATRLIFSYPLWEGDLNIGTELTFVNRKSDYDITEENIRDSRNEVKENTYAAFVEYGRTIPYLGQLNFGARYEHMDFTYADPYASSLQERHPDNIYPYISLGCRTGAVQGSLSYSVKTRRPNYRCLRSNVEYNNRFTLSTGNPTLSNEIRHEAAANGRWKWLGFSLSYAYIKKGIYDWTYPHDDEGTVLLSWVNLDSPLQQMGTFLNASPSLGIWQPNYTIGVQKQWLSFLLDDPRSATGIRHVRCNKPIFFCNAYNAFRMPVRNGNGWGAWLLEVNSELMSGGHWGNAEIDNWSWNLSCAVQKAFLREDALTVRIAVGDILHKTYNNVRIDLGNYMMTQSHILGAERECHDFQRLTLSIRYRLNVGKSRYRGNGAGKEMLNRM